MKGSRVLGMVIGLLVAYPAISSALPSRTAEDHGAGARYTLAMCSSCLASPWTAETTYAQRASQKFLFGSKNTLLGWTELYNEPRDARRANQSVARGIGRGFAHMLGDTLGGIVHLATFPITAVDVRLPEGGTDVL